MDLEHLNKTQTVLLTLLVSFVTSIATGIVTVTLLDQAPPEITQTINRVVERTVEKITPEIGSQAAAAKEVTVVVKDEDLITDSIEKNKGTLVRILATPENLPEVSPDVVALGTVIDKEGHAAVPRSIFAEGMRYSAVLASGNEVSFKILNLSSTSSVALLEFAKIDSSQSALTFPKSVSLKLGQTVIAISGLTRTAVAIGIVSGLEMGEGKDATSTVVSMIDTNINPRDALPGSPLLNIFGEAIGIRAVSLPETGTAYIPITIVLQEMRAVSAQAPKSN